MTVAEHLPGMRQNLGYIPIRKETEEERTEEKKSKF